MMHRERNSEASFNMLPMQTVHGGVRMGILNAPYCLSKRAAWLHDSVIGVALYQDPCTIDHTTS